jgi:homoserine O-acetyltransferase
VSTTADAGIGTVDTETLRVFEDGLDLDCGRRLGPVTVAFERYGAMSPAKDNVILVCHALSGGAPSSIASCGATMATMPSSWNTRRSNRSFEGF